MGFLFAPWRKNSKDYCSNLIRKKSKSYFICPKFAVFECPHAENAASFRMRFTKKRLFVRPHHIYKLLWKERKIFIQTNKSCYLKNVILSVGKWLYSFSFVIFTNWFLKRKNNDFDAIAFLEYLVAKNMKGKNCR